MNTKSLILIGVAVAFMFGCTTVATDKSRSVKRGQVIYAKECSQCHSMRGEGAGPASLGLGVVPPDLVGLKLRNDGNFPHAFVSRLVKGVVEHEDPNSPMPEFANVGFQHVYPKGGADGEVLEADFDDLLNYLEAIQK